MGLSKPIIILNAPPNSGKDTIADELVEDYGYVKYEFKYRLNQIAKVIANMSDNEWLWHCKRENKETPTPKLFGLSPRQFQITISEDMVKPNFGYDYFGKVLGKEVAGCREPVVISDGGFVEEYEALCSIVGKDRVYVVQFTRKGCSFDNDSRNFLPEEIIPKNNLLRTTNDGKLRDIVGEIGDFIMERV